MNRWILGIWHTTENWYVYFDVYTLYTIWNWQNVEIEEHFESRIIRVQQCEQDRIKYNMNESNEHYIGSVDDTLRTATKRQTRLIDKLEKKEEKDKDEYNR